MARVRCRGSLVPVESLVEGLMDGLGVIEEG
jgi:hypothetical protein